LKVHDYPAAFFLATTSGTHNSIFWLGQFGRFCFFSWHWLITILTLTCIPVLKQQISLALKGAFSPRSMEQFEAETVLKLRHLAQYDPDVWL